MDIRDIFAFGAEGEAQYKTGQIFVARDKYQPAAELREAIIEGKVNSTLHDSS